MKLLSLCLYISSLAFFQPLIAQNYAISKKLKPYELIPLQEIKNKTLVYNHEFKKERFELWDGSLRNITKVADVNMQELQDLGDYFLIDAMTNGEVIRIIQGVKIEDESTQFFIGTFDTKGNKMGEWLKIGEIASNKFNLYEDHQLCFSQNKDIVLFSQLHVISRNKTKLLVMAHRASDGASSSIDLITEPGKIGFESMTSSINDAGQFAFWFEADKKNVEEEGSVDKGYHRVFYGNIFNKDTNSQFVRGNDQVIKSGQPHIDNTGRILLFGLTAEKEDKDISGYFTSILNKSTNAFEFNFLTFDGAMIQKMYALEKEPSPGNITAPFIDIKGIYPYANGDFNLLFEYHLIFIPYRQGEPITRALHHFGSYYSMRLNSELGLISQHVIFRNSRGTSYEKVGSFVFMKNDKLNILFSDHPSTWKDGQRDPHIRSLRAAQIYYCTLTLAVFEEDGFHFFQPEFDDAKYNLVDMDNVALVSDNHIFGYMIYRAIKDYAIRFTLPNTK